MKTVLSNLHIQKKVCRLDILDIQTHYAPELQELLSIMLLLSGVQYEVHI